MRVITALLICLGMTIGGLSSFAQTSTSAPSAPASKSDPATEKPSAPEFEFLGRLSAETGARTVVENGPQGARTIVQIVGGRFEGPRVKATVQTPSGDWITNRADGSYRLDVRLTLKTDNSILPLHGGCPVRKVERLNGDPALRLWIPAFVDDIIRPGNFPDQFISAKLGQRGCRHSTTTILYAMSKS